MRIDRKWNGLWQRLWQPWGTRSAAPKIRPQRRRRVSGTASVIESLEQRQLLTFVTSFDVDPSSLNGLNDTSVTFLLKFNSSVTGVDADDFRVRTSDSLSTSLPVSVLQSDAATYTVTVDGLRGSGELRVELVDDDSISDGVDPLGLSGTFNGSYWSETVGVTQQAPRVSSIVRSQPSSPTTAATTVQFTVTFTTPVIGVDSSDFQLALTGTAATGSPLSVSGSGTTYTVEVTDLTGLGDVGLDLVDDNSITDLSGNPLVRHDLGVSFSQTGAEIGVLNPVQVAFADLNGDQVLDKVTIDTANDQLFVALGVLPGQFDLSPDAYTLSTPAEVKIADVNGDGFVDLITRSATVNVLQILIGDGLGAFTSTMPVELSSLPSSLELLTDRDSGFPQIMLAFPDLNEVRIYSTSGAGLYFTASTLITGATPTSAAAARQLADGPVMIAVANQAAGTVGLYLKDLQSGYQLSQTLSVGGNPKEVLLRDLDGDGLTDIVVLDSVNATLSVYYATDPAVYSVPQVIVPVGISPVNVEAGDLNGDGFLDLVVNSADSGAFTVFQGSNVRTLQPGGDFGTGVPGGRVTLIDVNQDGRADVFTTQPSGVVYTWSNTGNGSFTGEAYTLVPGSPQITSNDVTFVPENIPVTDVVLDVEATPGQVPIAEYSLSGPDQARFVIDATTGEIRFVVSPDYELPVDADTDNVYQVTVTVRDEADNTATQDLTIYVYPEDEFPLEFVSPDAISVDENTPDTQVILTPEVADQDEPFSGSFFEILGPDAERFTLDFYTGEIRFLVSPDYENPLDANGDNVYEFELAAYDSGENQIYQTVTVTVLPVNEFDPDITTGTLEFVSENTPATNVVLDVEATDADLPQATLSYALSGDDAAQFTIDTQTGEIRFVVSPDYENPSDLNADNVYDLLVTVSDGGGRSSQQFITIFVMPEEDNPTVFLSPSSVSVDENTSVETPILQVEAIDNDRPSGSPYYLIYGADAERFSYDEQTQTLRFLTSPDYENPLDQNADNVYEITVDVYFGESFPSTQNITITVLPVNDNSPLMELPPVIGVPENTPAQFVVLTALAFDADLPAQNIIYSLSGPDAGIFTIDPASGEIAITNSPDFEQPLDVNQDNTYELVVTASDGQGGETSQTVSFVVENLNEPPEAVAQTLSLLEDQSISRNLEVTGLEGEEFPVFSIETLPQHGTVVLHDEFTGAFTYTPDPDFNGTDSFTFRVGDPSTLSAPAEVILNVAAVNDSPQYVSGPDIEFNEDAGLQSMAWASGVAVGPVTAIDELNQTLQFVVTNDNPSLFAIAPTIDAQGNLIFQSAPDADGVATVEVILQDSGDTANGGVNATEVRTFLITIVNVNDPPVVNDITFSLRENVPAGTSVGTVSATDTDEGDSLTFSIVGGNSDGRFAINPVSGQITVVDVAGLENDPHPTYELQVQVTDTGLESTTATVTVQVIDALVIDLDGTIRQYEKLAPPIAIDPTATARDLEVPNINYNFGTLRVSIENPEVGDLLGILTQGNGPGRISVIHNYIVYESSLVIVGQILSGLTGGPLEIQLTSFSNDGAVDALLQSISFRNTSTTPVTGLRTITYSLRNGAGDERDVKQTQVEVVNRDVPTTFTIPPGDLTYIHRSSPTSIAFDAVLTDPDTANFRGGSLTVSLLEGTTRKVRLRILEAGGITVAKKVVYYQGQEIGRLAGKRTALAVELTSSSATPEAVQALVRSIGISTSGNGRDLSDRVVGFTFFTGQGTSLMGTRRVRILDGRA